MSWLRDIICKFLDVVNTLPLKPKIWFMAGVMFMTGGYFFYKEYNSYQIQIVYTKQMKERIKHVRKNVSDNKIIAQSSANVKQ